MGGEQRRAALAARCAVVVGVQGPCERRAPGLWLSPAVGGARSLGAHPMAISSHPLLALLAAKSLLYMVMVS